MPRIGLAELIVILIGVLILFGPKNLPKLGAALGKTVKNVRDGMDGKDVSAEIEGIEKSNREDVK